MSPRTKEQVEKIRQVRKATIADAALKLFSEHSYRGTSIAMIANEAGISKGLLYNYFESKEALLYEIMVHGMTSLMVLFDENKDGIISREEMVKMIDTSFDFMMENAVFYRLFFSLLLQPGVYEMIDKLLWEAIAPFQKMILDYYTRQGSPDPMGEFALLLAILDGVGMHYMFRPNEYPIGKVKKIIVERFVKA